MKKNASFNVQLKIEDLEQFNKLLHFLGSEKIEFELTSLQTTEISTPKAALTKKQIGKYGDEVLALLAEGYTYNEIAEKIGISVNNVRLHIKKIYRTLNVTNGRDAIRIYLMEYKK